MFKNETRRSVTMPYRSYKANLPDSFSTLLLIHPSGMTDNQNLVKHSLCTAEFLMPRLKTPRPVDVGRIVLVVLLPYTWMADGMSWFKVRMGFMEFNRINLDLI